jgi:sigma-B regulation protein RsbU (phosphoserine phosphatase)
MLKQEASYEQLLARVQDLEQHIELLTMEKTDLELLLETTTEHATEIENELQEKNEQVERFFLALQKELQTGRKIQADFLPQELPSLPGWELAASFAPAREVAGDFYDAFLLPDNQLGLVIADVCDKGVGAALFMSLTRSLIRVLAYQAKERLQYLSNKGASYMVELPPVKGQVEMLLPAHIFEVLNAVPFTNDYIATNHGQTSMFATLFFGVLDAQKNTLYFINGGHDAPIHIGQNGIKGRLPLTGPAVGMLAGARYKMNRIQFEPGDVLLTYTDGVPEARGPHGEFFTEKRLLELVDQCRSAGTLSASGLLERIASEVTEHVAGAEPSDDITMLAIHLLPPANPAE